MKEAFDLIRKRMREELTLYEKAIQIVSEVESEYCNGKTNADRIRSMSDEELADLTLQYDDEYGYFYCSDGTSYQDYGNSYEEALKHEIEWLKSPTTD